MINLYNKGYILPIKSTMKYKFSLLFLFISIIFLNSCISNYLYSPISTAKIKELLDIYEDVSLEVMLDVSADMVYPAAKRILNVNTIENEVTFVRLQKSHTRRQPLLFFTNENRYDNNNAGAMISVVRRVEKPFSNLGIIWIYPKKESTLVKLFTNNRFKNLFPTTDSDLLTALARTIVLEQDRLKLN